MADLAAKFKANLRQLMASEVRVGWFENNKYPDSGIEVAQVAYWNEYGTATIPARAPMRVNMDTNGTQIRENFEKTVAKSLEEGDVRKRLERFGLYVQGTVQDTIASGLPPPNAESTVHGMLKRDGTRFGSSPAKENRTFGQGKGFDKPLIDTGRLMKTVTYTVEEEG